MIPVNEPIFGEKERELLKTCIDNGWISSEGPFVKEFEKKFSSYVGCKYGISVCNGTAAIETALAAAGIKKGHEVILPSFTIISCAIAILRVGATPVLVDSEPNTWNMDVSQIKSKITPRTKAIMPVHIYGHPVDMDPVIDLAEKYGLVIVEDAAEAHGAEYKHKKTGSLGHAAAFSFYANKIVTTGEGGMVVTNDDKIAEDAAAYRNLCFRPERRFYHTRIGYNFRMTSLQAAVGIAQMERIDEFVGIKLRNAKLYTKHLRNTPGLKLPIEEEWAKNVYWMYGVVLDDSAGTTAEKFAKKLKEKGIETRPFFLGLHEQPCLKEIGLFNGEKYPVAERIARKGLYLPSGLTLTEEQILKVCDAVRDTLKEAGVSKSEKSSSSGAPQRSLK